MDTAGKSGDPTRWNGVELVEDAVLQLPQTSDAPLTARRFVAEHRDHLPAALVEDAQLLVSELVTNAIRHASPPVTVRVRVVPSMIGVEVGDRGVTSVPHDVALAADIATSGRGLSIVAALADAWGVEPSNPSPGKTVWFELGSSA